MERKMKALQETKNIFENLKTHPKSVLFSEDKISNKLLKKLKKSPNVRGKQLLKLMNLLENNTGQTNDIEIPMRVDYVEKRETDRSMLYSFDGPFQLLHADVANLELLGKSASVPNYALYIYILQKCMFTGCVLENK